MQTLELESTSSAELRKQAQDSAKNFKSNWLELAGFLYAIKKDKLFKEWNYLEFDTYCTKEIGIRKQTAFKLLNSYHFLSKEEPQYLEKENLDQKNPSEIPHYKAVDILRRAKFNKGLPANDYSRLRENVLERVTEPREVGKQFRSMISAARSIDPEEERKNRKLVTIKRLISSFKTLRKEASLLKILPENMLKEADQVIISLESRMKEEY